MSRHPGITITTSTTERNEGDSAYPFRDNATYRSLDGTEIPRAAFQNAILHADGMVEDVHVQKIEVTRNRIRITVRDGEQGEIGAGETTSDNEVVIYNPNNQRVGLITGNFDLLRGAVPGPSTLRFGDADLPFVGSVLVPRTSTRVSGIRVDGSNPVGGDLWLVGGEGLVIRVENNTLTLHAVGDKYAARRFCERAGANFTTPRPLKRLVVQKGDGPSTTLTPDALGNIQIFPGVSVSQDNVLRIRKVGNGLRISAIGNFD